MLLHADAVQETGLEDGGADAHDPVRLGGEVGVVVVIIEFDLAFALGESVPACQLKGFHQIAVVAEGEVPFAVGGAVHTGIGHRFVDHIDGAEQPRPARMQQPDYAADIVVHPRGHLFFGEAGSAAGIAGTEKFRRGLAVPDQRVAAEGEALPLRPVELSDEIAVEFDDRMGIDRVFLSGGGASVC